VFICENGMAEEDDLERGLRGRKRKRLEILGAALRQGLINPDGSIGPKDGIRSAFNVWARPVQDLAVSGLSQVAPVVGPAASIVWARSSDEGRGIKKERADADSSALVVYDSKSRGRDVKRHLPKLSTTVRTRRGKAIRMPKRVYRRGRRRNVRRRRPVYRRRPGRYVKRRRFNKSYKRSYKRGRTSNHTYRSGGTMKLWNTEIDQHWMQPLFYNEDPGTFWQYLRGVSSSHVFGSVRALQEVVTAVETTFSARPYWGINENETMDNVKFKVWDRHYEMIIRNQTEVPVTFKTWVLQLRKDVLFGDDADITAPYHVGRGIGSSVTRYFRDVFGVQNLYDETNKCSVNFKGDFTVTPYDYPCLTKMFKIKGGTKYIVAAGQSFKMIMRKKKMMIYPYHYFKQIGEDNAIAHEWVHLMTRGERYVMLQIQGDVAHGSKVGDVDDRWKVGTTPFDLDISTSYGFKFNWTDNRPNFKINNEVRNSFLNPVESTHDIDMEDSKVE